MKLLPCPYIKSHSVKDVVKVKLLKNSIRLHLLLHVELRVGNVAKVQDADTGFLANQLIGSLGAENTDPVETINVAPPASGQYLIIQTVQDVGLAIEEINVYVNEY